MSLTKDITREDVAKMLDEKVCTIYSRERKLGIVGQPYTMKNIDLIKSATRVVKRNSKNKIHVITYYLAFPLKKVEEIAQCMELSIPFVKKAIKEYLSNDGCIFVDSKLNYDHRLKSKKI